MGQQALGVGSPRPPPQQPTGDASPRAPCSVRDTRVGLFRASSALVLLSLRRSPQVPSRNLQTTSPQADDPRSREVLEQSTLSGGGALR